MKVVVSFSGGMDSLTLLVEAVVAGHDVLPIGFCYGSKHNQYENAAAHAACKFYKLPYKVIDLTTVMGNFKSDLLKTGDEIPEGHYEAESMRRTVVPGRNTIFAAILSGIAASEGAEEVWLGIHGGDHFIYPDCRPPWFESMKNAVEYGSDGKVTLAAPYLHQDKVAILQRGFRIGVPYELSRTCYKDQPIACGQCGSCQERLTAFATLGVTDPAEYATRELISR